MDFWRFLADGKSLFLPEELDLSADNSMRERNKGTGQVFSGSMSTYPYESNTEASGNSELGCHDVIGGSGKAYSGDHRRAPMGAQIGTHAYDEMGGPPSDSIARQIESGHFEAGVDLKLGRLPDTKVPRSIKFSNEPQHACSSSSMPHLPAKRTRMTGMSSQNPLCQVEGCNRDLSSFKDYYKRHRVCDAHTKTAIVVVNGIQQRFCQQCSRFHLLGEFDDVKRSCRKRLANHNERRRKPHGVKFSPSSLAASYVFQEMLPPSSSSSSFGNHESGKLINGPVKFIEPTTQSPTSFLDFSCSGKGSDSVALEAVGDKMVKFDRPGSSTSQNASVVPESSTCALSLLSSDTSNISLLGPSMSRSNQNHYISTQGLNPSLGSLERSGASYFNPVDSTFVGPNTNESGVVDLYQLSSHLKRVERKRDLGH